MNGFEIILVSVLLTAVLFVVSAKIGNLIFNALSRAFGKFKG